MSRLARIAAALALIPVFAGVWWYFERQVPMDPDVARLCRDPTPDEVEWVEAVDAVRRPLSRWWIPPSGAWVDRTALVAVGGFPPPAPLHREPVPRAGFILEGLDREEELDPESLGPWSPWVMWNLVAGASPVDSLPRETAASIRGWSECMLGMADPDRLREGALLAQTLHEHGFLAPEEWNQVATRVAEGFLVVWVNELQPDPQRVQEPHRWGRWINEMARELRSVESWPDLALAVDLAESSSDGTYGPEWKGRGSSMQVAREILHDVEIWAQWWRFTR